MAELDSKPRQSSSHVSEAGKARDGPPKTSQWHTYLVAFRERQTFCLFENPLFSACASTLPVWTTRDVFEAGVWVGWKHLTPSPLPVHTGTQLLVILALLPVFWKPQAWGRGGGIEEVREWWIGRSGLKPCITTSKGCFSFVAFFFFFCQLLFLSFLLNSTLLYPKCHIVIVLLDRSSIFRNGGFIFIAQLVCQRSHNLATFPVVKN